MKSQSVQTGRRRLLKTTLGAAVAAPFINLGSYKAFASSERRYSKRAIELVGSSLIIDMLSLLDMTKFFTNAEKGKSPLEFNREELIEIKSSGIDVFHPAVGMGGPTVHEDTLKFMAAYNGLITDFPDLLMRIDSAQDLDDVSKNGRIGIILGLQNSDHFRTAKDVKEFYFLGQRISQLTYNSQNLIGSGSTDRVDGGISDFGESIIKAMNEVGMAVDVSHCGDQTTLDAFEISKAPVMITHSNVRALAPGHPRCKTDEAIKKVADSGSIMGITSVRNFVTNDEPTTIEDFVDHIEHVIKVAGIEHAGVGTDADLHGYDDLPEPFYSNLKGMFKSSYAFRDKIDIEGMDHPQKMFDLTEALIRRGYSDDNIRAILGGNAKRVLSEIWG